MSASAIDLQARPDLPTRLLAGVSVPNTTLIARAIEFARERSEPYLFNHVTRVTTTYDNFARDFGERFVPGYKPVSTLDYLLNSPFKE